MNYKYLIGALGELWNNELPLKWDLPNRLRYLFSNLTVTSAFRRLLSLASDTKTFPTATLKQAKAGNGFIWAGNVSFQLLRRRQCQLPPTSVQAKAETPTGHGGYSGYFILSYLLFRLPHEFDVGNISSKMEITHCPCVVSRFSLHGWPLRVTFLYFTVIQNQVR